MTQKLQDTTPWKGMRKRKVSHQREWQKRMRAEGRCVICGEEAVTARHCEFHRRMVNAAELKRKKKKKK